MDPIAVTHQRMSELDGGIEGIEVDAEEFGFFTEDEAEVGSCFDGVSEVQIGEARAVN